MRSGPNSGEPIQGRRKEGEFPASMPGRGQGHVWRQGPQVEGYTEREDSKFSFGTPEFLSIKLRKDQSPSNQIRNELIGVTNLYQIPQQSHERKVRTVGEKMSQVFPERHCLFSFQEIQKSPIFSPSIGGRLCLEPASTFPRPMPPHKANFITFGHCSPVRSGCFPGVLVEVLASMWAPHSSGFSRWRGMSRCTATGEKMPARGRSGWIVPGELSGQGRSGSQPSDPTS